MLLGHDQRLGLERQVAVVAAVVQRGRHHGEAGAERVLGAIRRRHDRGGDWGGVEADHARRGAGPVVDAARDSVGDQQLVVELRLRGQRAPGLARSEQCGDLVLIAIFVAGLHADDEWHGRSGLRRGRGDVRGRARRIVRLQAVLGGVGRLVVVAVGNRLVAGGVDRPGLAAPRLELGSAEDRASDRVVGDRQVRSITVGKPSGQHVGPVGEAGHQTLEIPIAEEGKLPRHVASVDVEPCLGGPGAGREEHLHQRLASRDQVSPRGEHGQTNQMRGADRKRARARRRRRGSHGADRERDDRED
jgi:hypothetical protein